MSGIWTTLGVERTRDRTTVRRAYAALLKTTNPEDDPEGFKRLREAYDAALIYVDEGYEPYGFGGDPETWDEDDDEPEADEADADGEGGSISDLSPRERVEPAARVVVDREDAERRRTLDDACQRLADLVRSGAAADADAIRAAAAAVMTSEALIDVGTYNGIEAWMADLIAWNLPATDPLVEPAIDRFDWRARGRTLTVSHAIETVLAREDEQRFLRQVRAPRHPHHAGFKALTTAPDPKVIARWRWAFTLPYEVRNLLQEIDQRVTLHNDLNPDAVDWWRERLSRPAAGPMTVIFVFGAPVLAMLLGAAMDITGAGTLVSGALGYVGGVAVTLTLAAIKHFAFDLPRHRWREEWSWRTPDWARVGWVGAGAAVMAAAALLPAHPVSIALVALLSFGVLVWAFTVGDEVDESEELSTRIGRALWASAMLAVFWVVMMWQRPWLSSLQLSIPVVVTAVGFARNPMGLFEVWRRLRRWERLTAMTAVAGVAVFAFCLGLSDPQSAMLTGVAAVLVAAVSLLQRTPAILQGPTAAKARYYIGLATVIGAGQGLRYLDIGVPLFTVGMIVLVIGAVASLVFSFFAELTDR